MQSVPHREAPTRAQGLDSQPKLNAQCTQSRQLEWVVLAGRQAVAKSSLSTSLKGQAFVVRQRHCVVSMLLVSETYNSAITGCSCNQTVVHVRAAPSPPWVWVS